MWVNFVHATNAANHYAMPPVGKDVTPYITWNLANAATYSLNLAIKYDYNNNIIRFVHTIRAPAPSTTQ